MSDKGMWRVIVITSDHVTLNEPSAWPANTCMVSTSLQVDMVARHERACMRVWIHVHTSALHTMYAATCLFPSSSLLRPFSFSAFSLSPLLNRIHPFDKPSPLQPRAHEPGAPLTPASPSERCLIASPSWPPHPCRPFLLSTSDTCPSS